MFHGRISLNSMLLLLGNFVVGFRLESIHISLIVGIRSSYTHLHGLMSSQSTADLLVVVSERIARAFNRSKIT